MSDDFEYEIALSFSGADRRLVREVYEKLTQAGINVFYDETNVARLWGAELLSELAEIYGMKARFVMPFISEHYMKAKWAKHEITSARIGAFERDKTDWVLPVRLDDTQISEIPSTIGYVDIRKQSPDDLVRYVRDRLNKLRQATRYFSPIVRHLQHRTFRIDEANFEIDAVNAEYITIVASYHYPNKFLVSANETALLLNIVGKRGAVTRIWTFKNGIPADAQFSRASGAAYFDGNRTYSAALDEPLIIGDVEPALLLEPSRTNLAPPVRLGKIVGSHPQYSSQAREWVFCGWGASCSALFYETGDPQPTKFDLSWHTPYVNYVRTGDLSRTFHLRIEPHGDIEHVQLETGLFPSSWIRIPVYERGGYPSVTRAASNLTVTF